MADPRNGTEEGSLAAQGVVRWVVRVPKKDAAFLYFQLEAREGVCFHSTLDRSLGAPHRDVEIMAHESMEAELDRALGRIGEDIPVELLERGVTAAGAAAAGGLPAGSLPPGAEDGIARALGGAAVLSAEPLGRVSAGPAFKVGTDRGTFFLKCSDGPDGARALRKEAGGLRELALARAVRVPRVAALGPGLLLLELVRPGPRRPDFFQDLGRGVAGLHRFRGKACGFREDNFLGAAAQPNDNREGLDWAEFFWERRIMHQWRPARDRGLLGEGPALRIPELAGAVRGLLAGVDAVSLLHGDLWGGNVMTGPDGRAMLIDPAVYHGHREADLAMARLFGGFPAEFHDAYAESFPLEDGWEDRIAPYQLHHLLNHLNIFGRSWLGRVEEAARAVGRGRHRQSVS